MQFTWNRDESCTFTETKTKTDQQAIPILQVLY